MFDDVNSHFRGCRFATPHAIRDYLDLRTELLNLIEERCRKTAEMAGRPEKPFDFAARPHGYWQPTRREQTELTDIYRALPCVKCGNVARPAHLAIPMFTNPVWISRYLCVHCHGTCGCQNPCPTPPDEWFPGTFHIVANADPEEPGCQWSTDGLDGELDRRARIIAEIEIRCREAAEKAGQPAEPFDFAARPHGYWQPTGTEQAALARVYRTLPCVMCSKVARPASLTVPTLSDPIWISRYVCVDCDDV